MSSGPSESTPPPSNSSAAGSSAGAGGPPLEELVPQLYDELREIARHYFSHQPAGFTLRPTEMVNEACLHLMKNGKVNWRDADHFRAIATRKIWQVVVDHLKKRYAKKRGGVSRGEHSSSDSSDPRWARVPLDAIVVEWYDRVVDVLDLSAAMDDLARESRRMHEVVMLHWFAGMTYDTIAPQLGVSASTVEKDFRYALAWLNRRLQQGGESDGD